MQGQAKIEAAITRLRQAKAEKIWDGDKVEKVKDRIHLPGAE